MRFRRGDADGQTVVELALAMPVIILMFMVVVEAGFALHTMITVHEAASEAARYATTSELPDDPATAGCDPESIERRAVTTSGGLLGCDDVTVAYQNRDGGDWARGDGVSVRVSYDYSSLTPLTAVVSLVSGGVIPSVWTMNACAEGRIEIELVDQTAPQIGPAC